MYERIEYDWSLKATLSDSEYSALPDNKKRKYRKVVEDTPRNYSGSSDDSTSYGSALSTDFASNIGPSISFDFGSSDSSSSDSGGGFDFGGGDGGGGGVAGEW